MRGICWRLPLCLNLINYFAISFEKCCFKDMLLPHQSHLLKNILQDCVIRFIFQRQIQTIWRRENQAVNQENVTSYCSFAGFSVFAQGCFVSAQTDLLCPYELQLHLPSRQWKVYEISLPYPLIRPYLRPQILNYCPNTSQRKPV